MRQDFSQQPTPSGKTPLVQEAFQAPLSRGQTHPPLGEALGQLPRQYIRVFRKASQRTFAQEMEKASWALVWLQLLGLTAIEIAASWLFNLLPSLRALGLTKLGAGGPQWLEHLSTVLSHPLGQLLLTPLSFFLCSGILYLLARAVGGQGSFLAQSYTTLLFGVPLTLLADILAPLCGVTPFAGPILFAARASWPVAIYLLISQIQILMAVHALSWGKAAGVVVLTLLGAILISSVPGGSLMLGPGSF